ncbi:MAG: hypothetical protein WBG86_20625 [Polyangiales bacterium]
MNDLEDIDPEVLALLAQCVAEGPNELIEDEAFTPTADARF